MPLNLNNLVFLLILLPIFLIFNYRLRENKKEIWMLFFSICILFLFNPFSLSLIALLILLNLITSKIIKDDKVFKWFWIGLNVFIFLLLNYTLFDDQFLAFLNNRFLHQNIMPSIYAKSIILTSSAILLNNRDFFKIKSINNFVFFPKAFTLPGLNLQKQETENDAVFVRNISLLIIGLFQVNIASEILLNVANNGFRSVSLNFVQALITLLSNTFGYYLNVSGFLNIACGIIGISGYRIHLQMQNPFKENSVLNFFKCWFVGLSSIYISILESISIQNRKLKQSSFWFLPLFLIIFCIWHHPNNLIATLVFSVFISLFQINLFKRIKIPKWIKWSFTFGAINLFFLLLNAPDMQSAGSVLKGLTAIETIFMYYNEFWILWPIEANFLTVLVIIGTFISIKYPILSRIEPTNKWKWILIAILIISIAFHNANIHPLYNVY